jgi:hypothetical protein
MICMMCASCAMPTGSVGQGSPWLWAALALAVGALLWVVSKMLPKKEV